MQNNELLRETAAIPAHHDEQSSNIFAEAYNYAKENPLKVAAGVALAGAAIVLGREEIVSALTGVSREIAAEETPALASERADIVVRFRKVAPVGSEALPEYSFREISLPGGRPGTTEVYYHEDLFPHQLFPERDPQSSVLASTEWESISSLSDFPEAETLLDSLLTDLGAPPTQTSAARPARNDCPTSESRGYAPWAAPGAGTSGAVSGQWRWTC